MKEKDSIEHAAAVYFGKWVPVEDAGLIDHTTPETILLEKDKIRSLPRECEILKNILIDLPEEMFLLNGRVKRSLFNKVVKKKTGWDSDRIKKVSDRLKQSLESY